MSLINTAQINALTRLLDATVARQQAVATNIANVDTPGYSRQQADLVEAPAYFDGSRMVGTGVVLQKITSLRDRVLELRIQDEMQQQGSLNAQVNAMSDIDLQFSTQNASIGDSLNKFFNSLSNLATDPSNSSLRQSVLVSAQDMASQFRSTSNNLHQRQFDLDLQIQQAVGEVNQTTAQIADLNQKIVSSGVPEDQLGTYVDQRNVLLQHLSTLIGNHVITADSGLTVTTNDGTTLVVGNRSFAINTSKDGSGDTHLDVGGHDITGSTSGGSIAGLLQVKQQVIPSILANLDSIAASVITSFNNLHETGTDLNGNTGIDFFAPAPPSGSGAAAAFALNITDGSQIAASNDASAGGNAVLNSLIDLRNQPIVNGDRPVDAYSKLTFQVGSQLSNAKSDLQNSEAMLQQLNNQRGTLSGVSLDEEASDLIRFQRAYEAAARVLAVVSDLTEISVNLGKS